MVRLQSFFILGFGIFLLACATKPLVAENSTKYRCLASADSCNQIFDDEPLHLRDIADFLSGGDKAHAENLYQKLKSASKQKAGSSQQVFSDTSGEILTVACEYSGKMPSEALSYRNQILTDVVSEKVASKLAALGIILGKNPEQIKEAYGKAKSSETGKIAGQQAPPLSEEAAASVTMLSLFYNRPPNSLKEYFETLKFIGAKTGFPIQPFSDSATSEKMLKNVSEANPPTTAERTKQFTILKAIFKITE